MGILIQLFGSPIVNVISVALTAISIILAYVFYRRSKRSKKPCWAIRTNNLIQGYSSGLSGLEIFYKGEKVENLSVSRIMFWNDGPETIDRRDIASAKPLRITGVREVKLLDVQVLATNAEASQFTASPSGNSIRLDFDYLDQGQGAVVQVIHMG